MLIAKQWAWATQGGEGEPREPVPPRCRGAGPAAAESDPLECQPNQREAHCCGGGQAAAKELLSKSRPSPLPLAAGLSPEPIASAGRAMPFPGPGECRLQPLLFSWMQCLAFSPESSLPFSCLRTGTWPTGTPGSPACWLTSHIVELISLCNHLS